MSWVMVLIGAAIGAPMRYLVDCAVQARGGDRFPWGTLAVNLLACAILGCVTGAVMTASLSSSLQHLLGIGLAGTLSTYSTFSFEIVRLAEGGESKPGAAYALLSVVAGLGVALAATQLIQALL